MRPLISYALSSTYMSSDKGNYFSALIPLFVPIAEKNKGKIFNPTEFSMEVNEVYGLQMHPYVAQSFATSMVSSGLLRQSQASKGTAIYTYISPENAFETSQKYENFESKLAEVFALYSEFTKSLDTLSIHSYSQDELEEALISWLVSSKEQLSMANDYAENPKSDLQYTAARFVQILQKTNPDLFDNLAAISSGAIVSELVLDYQTPNTNTRKAKDLSVFLDAPFVMNLLDLSGTQNRINAQLLFDQLKQLECRIFVFRHSCEELEASIGAVLSIENTDKHGDLAHALNNREVIEDYARAVQRNPERFIKALGIDVMDMEALGNQRLEYFNDDCMGRFSSSLLNWKNAVAKDRDAKSLAYVMRLRGGKGDRDFLKSKCLFVTNNSTLARAARQFCSDEGLLRGSSATPIITVRTLSALLFLTLGSSDERAVVSRKQLVANCGKAAIATPHMMKAFYEKLRSFSPDKEDQIAAIINEPRSLQSIMDQTWGNPDVVSHDNFEQILERAKSEISIEQQEKHKAELSAVVVKMDGLSNDNTKMQQSIINAVRENVRRSIGNVNDTVFLTKALISGCLLLLAVEPALNGNMGAALSFGVAFSASLTLLRDLTDVWPKSLSFIGEKIVDLKKYLFTRLWKKVGLEYDLSSLSIDWNTGEVVEKPKDLLPTSLHEQG